MLACHVPSYAPAFASVIHARRTALLDDLDPHCYCLPLLHMYHHPSFHIQYFSAARDYHLVRDGSVDVHAVDSPARRERVRLHALNLRLDHRVLPRTRPRREAAPRPHDLPVRECVDAERAQDLLLDKGLGTRLSAQCKGVLAEQKNSRIPRGSRG